MPNEPNTKQILFKEIDDVLDPAIHSFFKRMLLDTHTVSKGKKVYRQEARRIFIKELTKNMAEQDLLENTSLNSKLLQNYCSLLLISQFLQAQDPKTDKLFQDNRVKAIF